MTARLIPAPYHASLADGPPDPRPFWVEAEDGVRLRMVYWPGPKDARGTVFLLNGRTEMIEKYGPAARQVRDWGHAALAIDWRGQGLSARALADPNVGHVGDFAEYQRDVTAAIRLARALGAPEPFRILAHSMGGAIGLRALLDRPDEFAAAAFSAPMWGIAMRPLMRLFAKRVARLGILLGRGAGYAPTTTADSYVLTAPFEGNTLTRDPEMFAWMKAQLQAEPGFRLGGPSLAWLAAALAECARLQAALAPATPALAAVGGAETVVDADAVRRRMASWPGGRLLDLPGARHEIVMETQATRDAFYGAARMLFDAG